MTDPRYQKLAKLLVNYSTHVKKGDHVLLDMIDVPDEFSIALMRAIRAAGGKSCAKRTESMPHCSATWSLAA